MTDMSTDAQSVRFQVATILVQNGRGMTSIEEIIADTLALADAIWTGNAPPPLMVMTSTAVTQ